METKNLKTEMILDTKAKYDSFAKVVVFFKSAPLVFQTTYRHYKNTIFSSISILPARKDEQQIRRQLGTIACRITNSKFYNSKYRRSIGDP